MPRMKSPGPTARAATARSRVDELVGHQAPAGVRGFGHARHAVIGGEHERPAARAEALVERREEAAQGGVEPFELVPRLPRIRAVDVADVVVARERQRQQHRLGGGRGVDGVDGEREQHLVGERCRAKRVRRIGRPGEDVRKGHADAVEIAFTRLRIGRGGVGRHERPVEHRPGPAVLRAHRVGPPVRQRPGGKGARERRRRHEAAEPRVEPHDRRRRAPAAGERRAILERQRHDGRLGVRGPFAVGDRRQAQRRQRARRQRARLAVGARGRASTDRAAPRSSCASSDRGSRWRRCPTRAAARPS